MTMRKKMRFLGDKRGLAAVEFALIAPMLAFTVVALADAAGFVTGVASMQRAERAGVQYYINGGTSTTVAKGIVTSTWTNAPAGYTVNAAQVCSCSNGTIVSCASGLCIVGAKQVNMTIAASATISGMLMSLPESKTETVRVQ